MNTVRVMLVAEKPLRWSEHADAAAMPAIGDEVEIDDVRYRVANRVWNFPKDSAPSLAITLTRLGPT